MKIGVIGLGLIGGSLAKAIMLTENHSVYGTDINETVISKAMLVGAIDGRLSKEECSDCDMLILALFPSSTLEVLSEYAPYIKKGAVVLDTCGVKRSVCDAAFDIAEKYGFSFVGAHPMAGIEKNGFSASRYNLFEDASIVLVPKKGFDIEELDSVRKFFLSIGFSHVVFSDAYTHDRLISYTSQLAHIVSSAYIKNPLSCQARGFSAGSFRDMTRVATLNEVMWTELFLANSDCLADQLATLIDELERYKNALEEGNKDELLDLLREGREAKAKSEESMKDSK